MTAKKRLFIRSDELTDGVSWYAGTKEEAAYCLANLLESAIEMMFTGDIEGEQTVDLEIREMTDDEVANLQDI